MTIRLDLGGLEHPLNGGRDRLLGAEKGQWLTDWGVICGLKTEVCERESVAKPQILFPSEKKIPPKTHIFPFLTGYSAPLQASETTILYAVHH